jgi:hypothetical protein
MQVNRHICQPEQAVCKTVGLASIHRLIVNDRFWPGPSEWFLERVGRACFSCRWRVLRLVRMLLVGSGAGDLVAVLAR